MVEKYSTYVARFLSKFLPVKLLSSFFGIGFTPAWQVAWGTVFFSFLIYLYIAIFHGLGFFTHTIFSLNGYKDFLVLMFSIQIKLFIILAIVSVPSNIIYVAMHSDNLSKILLHHIVGFAAFLAFSIPAIIEILSSIYANQFLIVCDGMLHCYGWFNYLVRLFSFFILPCLLYIGVETLKIWPISTIELNFYKATTSVLVGLICAFFTTIFTYLIAFLVYDLTVQEVINFYKIALNYALR